jgi:hypothetical protein
MIIYLQLLILVLLHLGFQWKEVGGKFLSGFAKVIFVIETRVFQ